MGWRGRKRRDGVEGEKEERKGEKGRECKWEGEGDEVVRSEKGEREERECR